METYLLTVLSILVSVGLFLLGYRKTIGARNERIRSANADLEKVLLRRIVLEAYQPTIADLSHLINGKARDCRVKPQVLFSEAQLLENIFTRIIESDFIRPEQRNEILKRISTVLIKTEETPAEEAYIAELPSPGKRLYIRIIIPIIMAILASIAGALVTIMPKLYSATTLLTPPVFVAFIGSFTIIIVIFLTYKFKESQEESNVSSKSYLQSTIDFEQEVNRILKKVGATTELPKPGSRFDFLLVKGNKKTIIELKIWFRRASMSIIQKFVHRLGRDIKVYGADEGIIVTKVPIELPPDLLKNTPIRIMSLHEFRNFIVNGEV